MPGLVAHAYIDGEKIFPAESVWIHRNGLIGLLVATSVRKVRRRAAGNMKLDIDIPVMRSAGKASLGYPNVIRLSIGKYKGATQTYTFPPITSRPHPTNPET